MYLSVLIAYYNAMVESIDSNKKRVRYINKQLSTIVQLLEEFNDGYLSSNAIQLLNGITFDDFLQDKLIIEAVKRNKGEVTSHNLK